MNPYRLISRFYDAYLDQAFYQAMMSLILEEKTQGYALDLATGTGQMAIILAANNFRVDGADISLDMLKEAEKQISKKDLPIKLYVHDILNPIGQTYDCITMASDVVNHLCMIEDVIIAFEHIHQALEEDGIFVFDAIHEEYASNMIDYQETLEVGHNTLHWSVQLHSKNSIRHHLSSEGEEETLIQYIYPVETLRQSLEDVGFVVTKTVSTDERTMFLVKKQAKRK